MQGIMSHILTLFPACPYLPFLLIIVITFADPIFIGGMARIVLPRVHTKHLAYLGALICIIPMLPFYYKSNQKTIDSFIARGMLIDLELTALGNFLLLILMAGFFYGCFVMAGIKLVDKMKINKEIKP